MVKVKNATCEVDEGDTFFAHQDDTESVLGVKDEDEKEQTPAWMRYMPKLVANPQDANTKLLIPVESEPRSGSKQKKMYSSNRFGPCREVVTTISVRAKRKHSDEGVDVDCEMGTASKTGLETVQIRKKLYRRYNVDEASMLLSMFDMKK